MLKWFVMILGAAAFFGGGIYTLGMKVGLVKLDVPRFEIGLSAMLIGCVILGGFVLKSFRDDGYRFGVSWRYIGFYRPR